jgi:hypothetical protein
VNQRASLKEILTKGLESHQVQIVQGCVGLGKTFFVNEWARSFVQDNPLWALNLLSIGTEPIKAQDIYDQAIRADSSGKRTLLIVDNIDRVDHFSALINSLNSLPNISCVGTSDVNIRVTESQERTHFADRCIFLNFAPLSYNDYLSLLNRNDSQAKMVGDYLRDGGIPSVLLSDNRAAAILEVRRRILHFVSERFHLSDYALLAELFDSYCRFGGFPKNEFVIERPRSKNDHSYNTILKYTSALSACFAISELTRVNADYFIALHNSPTYMPLDSCFNPVGLPPQLHILNSATVAIYNRLIADGCAVSVSVVNRQPRENGDRVYRQIETGFLVSKNSRTWFVTFAFDDGTRGRKAMEVLRNGFPKIIVVLPEVPMQMTSEGFLLVSLSTFLKDGLSIVKKMV